MQGAEANEIKSLAAGMLQAGATAILASLWPVDDRATYLLMVRFAQEWFPHMKSDPPAAALGYAQNWLRTVTNRELESWEVEELPPIAPVGKRETVKEAGKRKTALQNKFSTEIRSYRYDMKDAQKRLRTRAKEGNPDAHPFADPIYWAGFQITGW